MSTENYTNPEAKEKMISLARSIKIAMMVTGFDRKPLDAIPMRTQKIDDEGNIWFLSPRDSDHNKNISDKGEVQLLFSNPSGNEYLSVYGDGEITQDRDRLKDLYDNLSDNWFDGVDDPNLTAIKFTPKEAYFWDSKNNKYIALFKMGIAAVTGKEQEIGKKGKLDL